MSRTGFDAVIDDYLHRVADALAGVDDETREQVLVDLRAHIDDAVAAMPARTEAGVRDVLGRLGSPEDIAAAAQPDRPAREPRRARRWPFVAGVITFVAIVGGIGVAIGRRHGTPRTESAAPTATVPRPKHVTCDGVTFPASIAGTLDPPVCAAFGTPVTVGGVRVALGRLRAVTIGRPGQGGRYWACTHISIGNASGKTLSWFNLTNWRTASVSGADIDVWSGDVFGQFLPDALPRFGRLATGHTASGAACFAGSAKDFPNHLAVTWLVPGTVPIASIVWVGTYPH